MIVSVLLSITIAGLLLPHGAESPHSLDVSQPDTSTTAWIDELTREDSDQSVQDRIDSLSVWFNPYDNIHTRENFDFVLTLFEQRIGALLTPYQATQIDLLRVTIDLIQNEFAACMESLGRVDADSANLLPEEAAHIEAWMRQIEGSCQLGLHRYPEATESLLAALRYFESRPDTSPLTARILSSLASIEFDLGNYAEAIRLDQQGLLYTETTGDSPLETSILINLASSYHRLDSLDQALDAYTRLLEQSDLQQNPMRMARTRMNIGNLLVEMGQYDLAVDNLLIAYSLSLEEGLEYGVIIGLINLGNAYLEAGRYEEALTHTLQAFERVRPSRYAPERSVVLKNLSMIQEARGEYESSLVYLQQRMELSDSLRTAMQESTILELRERYEADLREQEIELTTAELVQQTRANRFLIIAWIATGVLFAVIVLVFLHHQSRLRRTFERNLREAKTSRIRFDPMPIAEPTIESEGRFHHIYEQIQRAMVEDERFRDPGLTLTQLAREMATNEKYTSTAIREATDLKFNDYVNMHRIRYAKRLIVEKRGRISAGEVMDASGFNTKSTFYSAFKAFTDLTPGQFIRFVKEQPAGGSALTDEEADRTSAS